MLHNRRDSIKELLDQAGFVNVQDLVSRFQVSSETIRRDLEYLEKSGFLRRVHGGAVSIHHHIHEQAYQSRITQNLEEKQAIARTAASLVEDGDTVIITPGTTTLEVSHQFRSRKELTVITNSLPVAMDLADCPAITVYCLGGRTHDGDFATSGIMAMENLSIFNAAKLILGTGGITSLHGLTDYRMEEAELLRVYISMVDDIICVADHSKFGIVSLYNICPADKLRHLVTDSGTPEETCRPYRELGVQVHIAGDRI